ncbi:hypothetical protein M8C13_36180 [Crossiella sp. SN42]|uniref:hypothetical protein n=1 Tax=Crossiella sp. SN42 TaxID=2944808 RepID=UPI00207CCB20|nr:hypothetical protein [Crossiella sp. SN42]MCO1581202.1 hypothetical protein [Crossiella sp. SN42]
MTATHDGPAPSAAKPTDELPADRLAIRIGGEAEAIRALTSTLAEGSLPDVFVAGGQLVHLSRVSGQADPSAPPTVTAEPLTAPALAFLLAHHTYCYRLKKEPDTTDNAGNTTPGKLTKVEASPTKSALAAVLSQRYWPGVRPLTGIVGSPVLRPDGTLLHIEGYDPPTGLYYAPTVRMPPIPTTPTAEEVTGARQFLLGQLLRDFPFVAEADRANHIGLLLAPILRPYLRCLIPFGLISATTQSSGKTLLAEVIGYLYGHKTLVWRKGDDAELEKAITSALHSSAPIMLWDNIKEGTEVASPVLAQLLTGPEWSARMLGSSGAGFTATNDRAWLATGNNLRLGGDMATRTVLIRLDPNDPHPDQRDQSAFGIPHLDTWLKDPANRVEVLRHLLILVLDWIAAGAPRSGHTMRQFSGWAQATGGLLAHHGIDGFLDNLADLREADDEDAEWGAFLTRWWELNNDNPMSATRLRQQAEIDNDNGRPVDRWNGAFLTDDSGRVPSAKSLGRVLTGHIGRWHGGYVLRSAHDRHANARVFWVEQAEAEGTGPQQDEAAAPAPAELW